MTDQEKIEFLATRVMGWSTTQSFWDEEVGQVRWNEDKDAYVLWNPLQNLADAWMILNSFKNRRFPERLRFISTLQQEISERLGFSSKGELIAWHEIVLHVEPKDICNAALKALGGMWNET